MGNGTESDSQIYKRVENIITLTCTDPAHTDYQDYLIWKNAKGNTAEEAD